MNNEVIKNIIELIHSPKVVSFSKHTLAEKLKNSGYCDNLYTCFDLEAKLINLQIFVGTNKIDLENLDLNRLLNRFEEVVVEYIDMFYKPRNKAEFVDIACENYFLNGYMFHGTSKKHYKNIRANGLNGNSNFKNNDLLKQVDIIFSSHRKHKCFEGKIELLQKDIFYASDHAYSGVYYAYQSPEHLSRFCANGHTTNGNAFDTFAYFRRDKKACLNNLKVICKTCNFSKKEEEITLRCFRTLWKENVAKNEKFYLFLIPRKIVDRTDFNFIEEIKASKSNKQEIIKQMLNPKYIHNRISTHVPPADIFYIQLLDLHKSFKNSSKGTKYITHSGKEYFYDLVLDVPNKQKIYYCFNCEKTNSLSNLILVSKHDYDKILKSNLLPFANEAIANTPFGQSVIQDARKQISLQKAKEIYINTCKKDLKKCEKLLDNNEKLYQQVNSMLTNYVVTLKVMIDNNILQSDLDTGAYSVARKSLDPHYALSHQFNSKTYDPEIVLDRLENIKRFIDDISIQKPIDKK